MKAADTTTSCCAWTTAPRRGSTSRSSCRSATWTTSTMITNLDIERYTCGDCHYLARALHKLTGWPMAAFVDRWGDPDRHAFVLTPDGDVFDVHGIESPHDARRRWRAPRRRIQTFEWP